MEEQFQSHAKFVVPTAVTLWIQVFWVVTLSSRAISSRRFDGPYPEDKGDRFIRNVGNQKPIYSMQQPRRPKSSPLSHFKLGISIILYYTSEAYWTDCNQHPFLVENLC
jgi:hypothetical protein